MNQSSPVKVVLTPYETVIKYINSFTYSVKSFELSVQITFSVYLYDQNGQFIDVRIITIEGEDYKNWGNDDSYIIQYIANKLSLELS